MFDDYLDGLDIGERRALAAIIDQVRKLAPDAEEGRSYGLPAFRCRGKPLFGFSATKKHLAVYPFSATVVASVKARLADFDLSKGAVRFTPDRPIPDDVVAQMVQERLAEIEG